MVLVGIRFETVATFTHLPDANAARSVLDSAGLEPRLLDEMAGSLHWALLPALGGLRLQVPSQSASQARELLGQFTNRSRIDEVGEFMAMERARRRKRVLGWIALVILLLPVLMGLLSGVALAIRQMGRQASIAPLESERGRLKWVPVRLSEPPKMRAAGA